MESILIAILVLVVLLAASLLGRRLRKSLPDHHLNPDSKDAVKLSMGLVATMTALVLGLLVSSAKASYDTTRDEVIRIGAKFALLDGALNLYGQEAAEARIRLKAVADETRQSMWSADAERHLRTGGRPGNELYAAIHRLEPRDDVQRAIKADCHVLVTDLAQLRALLVAQSVPSVSGTMLIIVVTWLAAIFLTFSMLAPPNATTTLASVISVFSATAAILLILELDCPFNGFLQISQQPMTHALEASAIPPTASR